MNNYTITFEVSDEKGECGTCSKDFQGINSWEALEKAIKELKEIGFTHVLNIQVELNVLH